MLIFTNGKTILFGVAAVDEDYDYVGVDDDKNDDDDDDDDVR